MPDLSRAVTSEGLRLSERPRVPGRLTPEAAWAGRDLLLARVRLVDGAGVEHVWSGMVLTDAYDGATSEARLLELGDVTLQLGDLRGQMQGSSATVTLSDLPDRVTGLLALRGFLDNAATVGLMGVEVAIEVLPQAQWTAGAAFIPVFRGQLRGYTMPAEFKFTLDLAGWAEARLTQEVPLFKVGDAFPAAPGSARDIKVPWAYGKLTDEQSDGASPEPIDESWSGALAPVQGAGLAGFSPMQDAAPAGLALSETGSGSNLVTGDKLYVVVTRVNAGKESDPSAEQSQVIGTDGKKVHAACTADGSDSYRFYAGTASGGYGQYIETTTPAAGVDFDDLTMSTGAAAPPYYAIWDYVRTAVYPTGESKIGTRWIAIVVPFLRPMRLPFSDADLLGATAYRTYRRQPTGIYDRMWEVPAPEPQHYWRLNEVRGTRLADRGHARFDAATELGSPTLTVNGISFDGTNDRVAVGPPEALGTTWTLEFVIVPDGSQASTFGAIWANGGGTLSFYYVPSIAALQISGTAVLTGGGAHNLSQVIAGGTAYHVILSCTAGDLRCYVNRTLTDTFLGAIGTGGHLNYLGSHDGVNFYKGLLRELAYYPGVALTTAEAQAHYDNRFRVFEDYGTDADVLAYVNGVPAPRGVVPCVPLGELVGAGSGSRWQMFAPSGLPVYQTHGVYIEDVATQQITRYDGNAPPGADVRSPGPAYAQWSIEIANGLYVPGADGTHWTPILVRGQVAADLLAGTKVIRANVTGAETSGKAFGGVPFLGLYDCLANLADNFLLPDRAWAGGGASFALSPPTWADGTPRRDAASFAAVAALSAVKFPAADASGVGFLVPQGTTWRDLLAQLCLDGYMSLGFGQSGALTAAMRSSTAAAAATVTATLDIVRASFSAHDDRLGFANLLVYWYAPTYDERVPAWALNDKVQDTASQARFPRLGKVPAPDAQFLSWRTKAAAQAIATAMVADTAMPPRPLVFQGGLHWVHLPLGCNLSVTHPEGAAAAGWTAHTVQVRNLRYMPAACLSEAGCLDFVVIP